MDTLVGYTFGDWLQLLKENKFSVDRSYWDRFLTVTMMSIVNSIHRRRELHDISEKLTQIDVFPPVFIIGHWRSGTTLLHNLISQDERFAFPKLFQTTNPHTFLLREQRAQKKFKKASAEKRHMDNIRVSFDSPGEDEPALAVLSLRSSLFSWTFPRNESYYNKFLTFENCEEVDRSKWRLAMDFFTRKLTLRYNRPILYKSPTHTAKLHLIHKLFPNAKFIHIYRNPYHVFQSTLNMYNQVLYNSCLQLADFDSLEDRIIDEYIIMFDSYYSYVDQIPNGNLIEIRFEELEENMERQVEKVYRGLDLPNFDEFRPTLISYISSIADYKKNPYPELSKELKIKITKAWKRNIETWGYKLNL